MTVACLARVAAALLTVTACSSSSTRPPDDAAADVGADGARDAARDSSPPDASPPECAPAEAYFVPFCDFPLGVREFEEGCYQPCTGVDDESCGGGHTCFETWLSVCACDDGEPCCADCVATAWLCLPSTPLLPCAGRRYCDCNVGCEPLVDLTTGCLCVCDGPFNCTGVDCDCDCGGATYLECTPIGACPETQVDCGDCEAVMVDGCPSCVCPG